MSSDIERRVPRLRATLIRAVILAVCAGALALSAAEPASAHAALLGSSPAENDVLDTAPATAELRFNEPVELIDGAIRLFPSSGDPRPLNAQTRNHSVIIDLPRDLADGTYSLSYRIVSADGHPVGGAITFQIGESSTPAHMPTAPDADETPVSTESAVTILTATQYLGLLTFAGLLFFYTQIRRASGHPEKGTRRAALWSLLVGATASALLIPVSALRITGQALSSIPDVDSWAAGFRAAPALLTIVAVAAGSLALLLFCHRRSSPAMRTLAVFAAALAAVSPVLVGHSQTMEPVWLMVLADIGHLLAGAFWTGGILGLILALKSANPRRSRTSADVDSALGTVERFSRFAVYNVILLAASGTLMAVLIFSKPSAVITTGYGRTLLIKLMVVAAIVAVAAWNRGRVLPSIAAEPQSRIRWARLRRTVGYEAALLTAVIALTGFLTNSSPDHQHHAQAQDATSAVETAVHAESQGLVVDGTIEPSATGANTFTFDLTYHGEELKDEDVEVSARLPEQQLGPLKASPTFDSATGRYRTQLTLPTNGDWQIQVSVRVSRFEQPIALVPVHIG